jgi:hypothetical protein
MTDEPLDLTLKDAHGFIKYIAKVTDEHSHSVTLTIFEVDAWDVAGEPFGPFDEVAVFYVKWDGCAHVGFRDPGLGKEWVHVCGADYMYMTIKMMEWAWDLAAEMLRRKGFTDGDLSSVRGSNLAQLERRQENDE